jgi:YD repeat-containing protein
MSRSTVTAHVEVHAMSDEGILSTGFDLEASTQLRLVCLDGYGPDGCITSFSPTAVELHDRDGNVLERGDPEMLEGWQARLGVSDDLGDVCALSVSLWTYLNFPFAMALDGFSCTERGTWHGPDGDWRMLAVEYPAPTLGTRLRMLAYIDAAGRTRRFDWFTQGGTRAAAAAQVTAFDLVGGLLVPVRLLVWRLCPGLADLPRNHTDIRLSAVLLR